jgi:hypothetical protein
MFHAVSQVIERHIAPPPPEPDAMDAFRYATPGKLRDILDGAGVVAPCERLLRFTMEAPVTLEQFWTMRCETSERLREMIARLSADQVGVVKREALEALREYSTASGMRFPSEVLIVSGTRNVT